MTVSLVTEYWPITCGGCGVQYALTDSFITERKKDHANRHCPNGCIRHFPQKSTEEQLRAELVAANRRVEWAREEAVRAKREAISAEMSRRVTKGHLTRIRKRVQHEVCPECNRTFSCLARHMKAKHPTFAKEATP